MHVHANVYSGIFVPLPGPGARRCIVEKHLNSDRAPGIDYDMVAAKTDGFSGLSLSHVHTHMHKHTHIHTQKHTCTLSPTRTHTHIHTRHTECIYTSKYMGWLRLVGSLKLQVSFAKEPYKRDDILQKRPILLRSLLTVATLYQD